MKVVNRVLVIILISLILNSCEDNDSIPTVYKKCKISLTYDYKITEVSNFTADTLVSISTFEYADNLITVNRIEGNNDIQKKSFYYINNHLADSCIDSVFIDSELRYIYNNQYTYNENGYLTNAFMTSVNYTNKADNYLTEVSLNYSYEDGNMTSLEIDSDCSHYFSFNSQVNKINISTFIGDYCGKINKNLKKSFNSGCHGTPSTVPRSSEYSWNLDENGLVSENTEISSSSYHIPDGEPQKTKIITKYEYLFIE